MEIASDILTLNSDMNRFLEQAKKIRNEKNIKSTKLLNMLTKDNLGEKIVYNNIEFKAVDKIVKKKKSKEYINGSLRDLLHNHGIKATNELLKQISELHNTRDASVTAKKLSVKQTKKDRK